MRLTQKGHRWLDNVIIWIVCIGFWLVVGICGKIGGAW